MINKFEDRIISRYKAAEKFIIDEIASAERRGLSTTRLKLALKKIKEKLAAALKQTERDVLDMIAFEFLAAVEMQKRTNTKAKYNLFKLPFNLLQKKAPSEESIIKALAVPHTITKEQSIYKKQLASNLITEIATASEKIITDFNNITIGRRKDDIFREAWLTATENIEAGEQGYITQLKRFVEQLKDNGVEAFIDVAGKRWSLSTYAGMVTRTTRRQAEVLGVLTRNPEHELYQLVPAANPCGVCAAFAGRVFSKSGINPFYPPLADAFGKINKNGENILENTYLNIHPNCKCAIIEYNEREHSPEEIDRIRNFSNPTLNPYNKDPRSAAQIAAYKTQQKARQKHIETLRQWERYKELMPKIIPQTFATFEKHKKANDNIYKQWQRIYKERKG